LALLAAAPADLTERVRAALADSLANIPKYTCTETIERHAPWDCMQCRVMDRVRLEVVVANGMDLYALPGGQVVDDAELRRYVPPGSFTAGNFSGTLKGIILDAAERRLVSGEGHAELLFSYLVPVEAGAYELGWGRSFAKAGYQGSFWIDAKTYHLNRLDSEVFGFPGQWDLERLTSKTTYRLVSIGGGSFSLPATSEVNARAGGQDYKIRMTFSGCKQYGAESSVRFGEAPQQVNPLAPQESAIPAGIDFNATLSPPINLYTAAAGDRVAARVASDRTPGIPKGALLRGRISKLARYSQLGRGDRWMIGIRFTELEIAGRTVPLHAIVRALSHDPARNDIRTGDEMLFGSTGASLGPVVLRCWTQ
jgi:hypothetical protein